MSCCGCMWSRVCADCGVWFMGSGVVACRVGLDLNRGQVSVSLLHACVLLEE